MDGEPETLPAAHHERGSGESTHPTTETSHNAFAKPKRSLVKGFLGSHHHRPAMVKLSCTHLQETMLQRHRQTDTMSPSVRLLNNLLGITSKLASLLYPQL